MKDKARAAILSAIEKEREGQQVDRALLKNVLDIFIEVGMNTMDAYEADFETALLTETGEYYKRKAAAWIQVHRQARCRLKPMTLPCRCQPAGWPRLTSLPVVAQEDTCPDYMLKAEECLRAEEARVANYLHVNTKLKLLYQVEAELLAKYEMELLEKEHSGCAALLRDDKVSRLCPARCLCARQPATSPCEMHDASCSRARLHSSHLHVQVLLPLRAVIDNMSTRSPHVRLSSRIRQDVLRAACIHEQKEDLARLYRLFQRVPKGLDPVAETFKRHVDQEGMKLVKEATEAMEARRDKDAGVRTALSCSCLQLVPNAAGLLAIAGCSSTARTGHATGSRHVLLCVHGYDGRALITCKCARAGKPSKEAGGANEQQFVRDVIQLHDKYLQVRPATQSALESACFRARRLMSSCFSDPCDLACSM